MEKNNAPHDIRHEEMLDFSRQNMINSLQLFFSHTKYSLTLLTTILAVSLAITAFSFDKLQDTPKASKLALILAATFLILMGPVSYITYRLIGPTTGCMFPFTSMLHGCMGCTPDFPQWKGSPQLRGLR